MAGTTLTWSVQITGGPTIDQTSTQYGFPEGGFSHGATSWRRTHAEVPWVEGRTLVSAVRDIQVGLIAFRVFGTSAEIKVRMQTLIDAFSQIDYDVTVTIDGQSFTWSNCEPAEFAIGSSGEGAISGPHMMAGQQNIVFQVPHSPGYT